MESRLSVPGDGTLIGTADSAIPYWIVGDELPRFPPCGKPEDPELRIIAVCSCGEYGCGHTQCRVVKSDDCVIFRDFDGDCSRDGKKMHFTFTRVNYDSVVSQIVADTDAQKQVDNN